MKNLVVFIVGAMVFGAAVLGGGFLAWGTESLIQASVALALTLPPAAATLAWVLLSFRAAPELQLLASLGGSGVRMAIALGGGLLLTTYLPQSFGRMFWCWLILFYLAFLGFEITLLILYQQPKVEDPLRQSGDKNQTRGASAPS